MSVLEEQIGVIDVPKYVDGISFNDNNHLALVASNLTGRYWSGLVAVFNDAQFAPNVPHIDYAALNEAGCTDVEWIDTERILVATDAGTVEVWQLEEAPLLKNSVLLSEHDDICSSISISKHSHQIASGSWDGCIKLWDLEVDLAIHNIHMHADKIFDVLWNEITPDMFASASEDGTVKIYDNRTGEKPASLLAFTPIKFPVCLNWLDQDVICAGYSNGDISLLDLKNPAQEMSSISGHKKTVNKVLFLGDDKIASVSDDMTVKIHMKETLKLVYTDSRHTDYVRGLAVNNSDGSLWSCAWDGCVLRHNACLSNAELKMEA